MRTRSFLAVIAVVGCNMLARTDAKQCTLDSVHSCLSGVFKDISPANITKNKLDDACKQLVSFPNCLKNSGCNSKNNSDILTLSWFYGINDSLTFLCEQYRKNFIDNINCLLTPSEREGWTRCNSTFFSHIQNKNVDFCKEGNAFVACIQDNAKRCSLKDGEILSTFTFLYINRIALSKKCALVNPNGLCTIKEVYKCMKPMLADMTPVNMTESRMQEACSFIGDTQICLASTGCSDDNTNMTGWHGVQDAMVYLCNQSQQGKLENSSCILSGNDLQGMSACNISFFQELRSSKTHFCRPVNRLMKCIGESVKSCGDNDAKIFQRFTFKLFAPIAAEEKCTIVNPDAVCTSDAIAQCIAPLIAELSPSQMNTERFNESCKLLTTVPACIADAGCWNENKDLLTMWRGLRDSTKYLCDQFDLGNFDNVDCLLSPGEIQGLTTCNGTFISDISSADSNFCGEGNKLMECFYNITDSCSEKDAKLFKTYIYKFLKPFASEKQCLFVNPSKTCSSDAVSLCLAPVVEHLTPSRMTIQRFNETCRLIQSVPACLAGSGCTDNDATILVWWYGVRDSTKYLCDQFFTGNFENLTCVLSERDLQGLSVCNATFFEKIGSNTSDFCNDGSKFMSCIKEDIKPCGAKDVGIFLNYIYKLLTAVAPSMSCSLSSPYKTCTPEAVNLCLSSVIQDFSPATMTLDKLDDACRIVKDIPACLTSSGCSENNDSDKLSLWFGIKDSSSYLCDQIGNLENVTCLFSERDIQGMVKCNSTFFEALNSGCTDFCGEANTFLKCVKNDLDPCGHKDVEIFVNSIYKLLDALAKQKKCALDPTVINTISDNK